MCVRGDAHNVPAAKVHVGDQRVEWLITIGLNPDLPVPGFFACMSVERHWKPPIRCPQC